MVQEGETIVILNRDEPMMCIKAHVRNIVIAILIGYVIFLQQCSSHKCPDPSENTITSTVTKTVYARPVMQALKIEDLVETTRYVPLISTEPTIK